MSGILFHVPLRRACRDICLSSVRATRCTPVNARARSWGAFARKPDLTHLLPRLRAAIEKKNEEKLAFQHIELPVEVYPEPPQTITTDEELKELAHLQPTSADLREWIDFAIENGHHSNAYDISRLFLVPLNGSALLDPNATSVELDWQLRDMLAISRQNSKLAAEGKLQPFDDPMDGAVLIAYQLDRIQLRYEAYASAVDATNAVLGLSLIHI